MSVGAKQFEAGSRDGERLLFAVGDWFRWANPMEVVGVTFFGRIADVGLFECGAASSVILQVEPHPKLKDVFRGCDTPQPGLSGNGGTLRATGHDILKEIYAGRFSKAPLVTGANVSNGGNGTLLTFTDANGVAGAVALGPGLAEELARQLAHTTAYPWENHAPVMVHCPRHSTRRIACGATCDMCLGEIDSCASAPHVWAGARVKVTRRRERDNGFTDTARAVRESHDGQIGTAGADPFSVQSRADGRVDAITVWYVRFDDGAHTAYYVDELTVVPGLSAPITESGVTT